MYPSTTSNGRVFVSSTCYDLIDLRASLEGVLKEAGLSPVMSDHPSSEFSSAGDTNSIETCLVNLRPCERCIVVLSQRYGPSLADAGFEDLSATHLEYREAIKLGIPVAFYARDRLLAEHGLWKKNPNLVPRWAPKDDAPKLFAFLDEHTRLENSGRPNWIWPFTAADDLCRRVLVDLGATASSAMIRRLSEQGRLPVFSLEPAGFLGKVLAASLKNQGPVNALRVGVRNVDGSVVGEPMDMAPGQGEHIRFNFGIELFSIKAGYTPVLRIHYETPTGDRLCDLFALLPGEKGAVRIVPVGRQCVGRSLRVTSPEITQVGTYAMVELDPINTAHTTHTL